MYVLIKADEPLNKPMPKPRVFLGGVCKGREWRLEFFTRFEKSDVTFINPRRDNFIDPDIDPIGHATQVGWERQALDLADIGVFWLGEGLSNQASRVEIGYMLGAGKPVLLGAEKKFMGVEHLTGFSGLVATNSIDGLMNRFASLLASYEE
ncbi:MAG: nucleoside 2-deoxyribosyltransferase domain-containing protein [Pseudomonadaceae bacterium]|nr:nucleoside 2-deoxyribosyltransferase domain-containing protein [Pseudomonadaceae bacterium]